MSIRRWFSALLSWHVEVECEVDPLAALCDVFAGGSKLVKTAALPLLKKTG